MSGVLLLTGPTASGKTGLAVRLAERFGAEIVSADSRQVYRGMGVGTAQPDALQRARVAHHLIDFLEPGERYSAARFVGDAMVLIERIEARGRRVIVAGGTGFYLRALTGEMSLADVAYDDSLRARLRGEARLHARDVLHEWLRALDPVRAAAVPAGDRYRTLRAIEVALARRHGRGDPSSVPPVLPTLGGRAMPVLKLALAIEREELIERVRLRAHAMIDGGLLAEAAALEGRDAPAGDAVGYPQATAYLRGMMTREELERALTRATLRYAKRQMTWLRSEPGLRWIAPGGDAALQAERAARETLGWT